MHLHDHDRHDVRQDLPEYDVQCTAIAGKPRRLYRSWPSRRTLEQRADAGVEGEVHTCGRQDDVFWTVLPSAAMMPASPARKQQWNAPAIVSAIWLTDVTVQPPKNPAATPASPPIRNTSGTEATAMKKSEPRRHDDAAENIAPQLVGAEPVRRRRRLQRSGVFRLGEADRGVGQHHDTCPSAVARHDQQKRANEALRDLVLFAIYRNGL